jgi:beta-glucosidase
VSDSTTAPDTAGRARSIVDGLTLDEKLALISGADFWSTAAIPTKGVPSVMVTDGPHGLRKQTGGSDHVGLQDSVPATCFPPAVGLGATWDPALLEEVGAALGRETRAEDVAVLLGPGLNIKRHPGGGRCFEYFSEDPYLSGKAAAALIRGIQSEGVGASVKHFTANNQESNRMRLDTIVDERTLRELYLTGFEIAVKESTPWTVMSAYNLVNGEHAGESRRLLTDILRSEWGFDGLVVSDWFATADRPESLIAGLDLEMPGSHGTWDERVRTAIEDASLAERDLDRACVNVVSLALRAESERAGRSSDVDFDAHHGIARRAAAAATVLLTNDGILPLSPVGRIALIGAFAEKPRYQGVGSSQVTPTRLDTALEAMRERLGSDGEVVYAPGYDASTGDTSAALLAEARAAAADTDVAVVMVGLPTNHESEGYDREHLRMPQGHHDLIESVTSVNDRVVVVLSNGAPVEIPWADRPAALVEAYLGGQASGSALVDVLFGDAEPGGRLAESFPVLASDLPSDENFARHPTQVEYRENLYVGYRFHDTFDLPARFPFGHGMTYTTFEFGTPMVAGHGTDLTVTIAITNTGDRRGSTVAQLYVHDRDSTLHRPEQELKGFAKVTLDPNETTEVSITLDRRSFAVYDVTTAGWKVEAGEFEIRVGASSRDIRASVAVQIESDDVVNPVPAPGGAVATDDEFVALLGHPIPDPKPLFPFHLDSTIADLNKTVLGKGLERLIAKVAFSNLDLGEGETSQMMEAVMKVMPLRVLAFNSQGKLSLDALERLISTINAAALRTRRGG